MNVKHSRLSIAGAAAMLFSATAFAAGSHASAMTNMFGGPIYHGKPNLQVTAALVKAGGGAQNFSFSKALVSMLGKKAVNAEVAKLTKQYGKKNVTDFINGMTFAVDDGLKRATKAGVKLPAAPLNLKGVKLAKTLVHAGTTSKGTFWAGYLFDHALSHKLHDAVMADIDAKYSYAADANTHYILNQAMHDVSQKLDMQSVKPGRVKLVAPMANNANSSSQ